LSPAASRDTGEEAGRIAIDTPTLTGSISLRGARFDDLKLKEYRETIAKDSDIVTLLKPASHPDGYIGEFGYLGVGRAPQPRQSGRPPANATLTPETPVELTYTAENGLVFKRTISVDEQYMFTIEDT
jgi:YidC/Oxa1 family membrane protein insertase